MIREIGKNRPSYILPIFRLRRKSAQNRPKIEQKSGQKPNFWGYYVKEGPYYVKEGTTLKRGYYVKEDTMLKTQNKKAGYFNSPALSDNNAVMFDIVNIRRIYLSCNPLLC